MKSVRDKEWTIRSGDQAYLLILVKRVSNSQFWALQMFQCFL